MKHYSRYGCGFIILLGYKGNEIKKYFGYYMEDNNIHVDLGKNSVGLSKQTEPWRLSIDTGLNTMTGGKVKERKNLLVTIHCSYVRRWRFRY